MVPILSLWLPILVAGVLVFVASSLIHMVLGYHNSDFSGVPNEAGLMDALRPFNLSPGEYIFPKCDSMKQMGEPEFVAKMEKGPMAFMTVLPNGTPKMGGQLLQWFVYSLIVGVFAAYIASRAVGPSPEYLDVFRFTGATAFFCYTVAGWQASIWYKRAWSTTLKNTFDGLVYALLTAGVFGWLWPS
ncbi:MAG: hypothetical protein Q8W45_01310 [Candidatus Palauibacterales bacterium]|jgi:hypothetical protein|nr:hypothetical protein [Candidatus Palauibacterales bacterium]MDP2481893.1 hypothetical protein [Candidatus Palauibacterales bacterium]